MGNVTLYIQARRNVEAQGDEVLLGDAASIYCEDSAIRAKANAMRIHKFHEGGGTRAVISMMKIIEKLIEAGVDNGEFICEDSEGTARNIMFVLEGLKISAQTIGVTAEAVDREILYLLRGLGVED